MLLAKIALKTERKTRATEALKKALKLNPFLWSCYECLCNIGEKPNPNLIFQLSGLDNLLMCHGSNIANIESVILSATPANKDGSVYVTTPQQILNEQITCNNSMVCTPEDSPLAQPLCLSGFGLLPSSKFKSTRLTIGSDSSVSGMCCRYRQC